MLHVDNYILFFKVNDFEINDFEITLQLTGLRWQILWICLILQSEFSRGGGQNKRRSYIFVFSDSNDLNCQNKTFMCTVKEHRHVSQQNRITSKTNKIQFYFQINEYFFYKDYRIITMYILKKKRLKVHGCPQHSKVKQKKWKINWKIKLIKQFSTEKVDPHKR